jgi:hypothetical protein
VLPNRVRWATAAAAAGLAAILLGQPLAALAACKFSAVPSANAVADGNDLYAASATAASDGWAVGYYVTTSGIDRTLIEHWDGGAWSVIPSPNPSLSFNFLYGTTAKSSSDAWAVGRYRTGSGAYQPLIEHWDGATWSVVASPATGTTYGAYLFGVKEISTNNVWAVGSTFINVGAGQTLIEHWNGKKWKIVPSPNVNTINDQIISVVANGATDVWAGGGYTSATTNTHQTLFEHWNGTAWSIVASPNINTNDNNINGMAALSPTKVYGTGDYFNGTGFSSQAEDWNGSTWAIQSSPNNGSSSTNLFGMAGSSATGAISVGDYFPGAYANTFAMRLMPSGWKIVQSDNVGSFDSFFNGAGAIPGTHDAWAVGGTTNSDHSYHTTLIELFSC